MLPHHWHSVFFILNSAFLIRYFAPTHSRNMASTSSIGSPTTFVRLPSTRSTNGSFWS